MTDPTPAHPDNLLRSEIKALINAYSRENVSNTPDHILADVMMDALRAYEQASVAREKWYGQSLSINGPEHEQIHLKPVDIAEQRG